MNIYCACLPFKFNFSKKTYPEKPNPVPVRSETPVKAASATPFTIETVKAWTTEALLDNLGICTNTLQLIRPALFSAFMQWLATIDRPMARDLADKVLAVLIEKSVPPPRFADINPDPAIAQELSLYATPAWITKTGLGTRTLVSCMAPSLPITFVLFTSDGSPNGLLKQGGFGTVFHDITQRYALKLTQIYKTENFKDTLREYQLSTAVSHPHIQHASHYFLIKSSPVFYEAYFISAFCPLGSLSDIEKKTSLNDLFQQNKRRWILEILSAIEALHAHNITHADIKKGNILVSPDFSTKLCDFGLASTFENEPTHSRIRGTFTYACPESFFTSDPLMPDKRDLWQMGVLAYLLESGKHRLIDTTPEQFEDEFKKFYQNEQSIRKTVFKAIPNSQTRAAIKKLLSSDPTQRPSATEAGSLLAQAFKISL